MREAIEIYEQNLKAKMSTLGADHPDTVATRNNLAEAYRDAGKLEEAIELYKSSLKSQEAKLGTNHIDTLKAKGALAQFLQQIGRFDEAEPIWDAIVAVDERLWASNMLIPSLPDWTARNLDLVRENYDAAEPIFRDILIVCRAKLGPEQPNTEMVESSLASLYEAPGEEAAAEPFLRNALNRARKTAADPDALGSTIASLGRCLIEQRKWSEAEPLLRECLAIREVSQPDAWNTSNARSMLGVALLGQGRHGEAEPLIIAGFDGMKARESTIPSIAMPRLAEAGDRILRLYDSWASPRRPTHGEPRSTLRRNYRPTSSLIESC